MLPKARIPLAARLAALVSLVSLATLLPPPRALAQSPKPVEISAGHLKLALVPGAKLTLSAHGVPFITESSLYIVAPGWTKVFLNQDKMNAAIRVSEEGSARIALVDYETAEAFARYRYELRPDDTFVATVYYGVKDGQEAKAQYHCYLNANALSGATFTAETVDGPRSGTIPIVPKEGSQEARKFTPDLKSVSFQSRLGDIAISVESDSPETSALTFFEGRTETQAWARTRPILWLGAGVPARTVAKDGTRITTTYRFGAPRVGTVATPDEAAKAGATKSVMLADAFRPGAIERPLIPRPKEVEERKDPARLAPDSRIVLPDAADEAETRAAQDLRRDLLDFWGLDLPVVKASEAPGGRGTAIFLGGMGLAFAERMEQRVPANQEGYLLDVKKDRVLVSGRDALGTRNGVQTLKQLIRRDEKGVYVRPVTIRDWPSLKFRGVHWFGGPESGPFHERMITRVVAPLKMNAMVYELDYMQWESQKEIFRPERGMTQDQVRQTVALAREHFIEPIPMIVTLGHVDWLFHNGQNRDIVMDPEKPYAYNPDAERTYDVVFPLLQEAIDVFQPRYFHIGHDEVTMTGRFPTPGYPKSATQLFIEDTSRLHAWLTNKGLTTMMWGDQMLHESEGITSSWCETPEDAKARREALPKDIVIADWHYRNADPSYPSIRIFQDLGYPVIGTGWAEPEAIRSFVRALVGNASVGYLQSTWAGFAMSEALVTGPEFAQFVGYLLAAEYAWNGGGPALADLGYSPAQAFLHFWNRSPNVARDMAGFTVDLSGLSNMKASRWLDLKRLPQAPGGGPRRALLDGYAFQVSDAVLLAGSLNPEGAWPKAASLALDRKADTLHFLWGTMNAVPTGEVAATLRVRYSDGTSVERPIAYGKEIFAFTDDRIVLDAPIAWRGRSRDGESVSLRRWIWTNPSPEKVIQGVEIVSSGTEAAPVLLGVTGIGG